MENGDMSEQALIERWQKEIEDRNERIRKLEAERDLYAAQAKMNAQLAMRQQHEIRRLEGSMARLQRILEDWGIVA
jgi:hypothetical protein